VASLSRLNYSNFEILVVDHAPSDERTAEVCRRARTHYVLEPSPGLSRARNRGARECSGDIIAYIDDDATAEPEWLSALVREFADPMVMAVVGGILPPHHQIGAAPAEAAEHCTSGAPKRVVDKSTPHWFEISNFGGLGIGANMSFRRSAFGVWPGFDERLGRGAVLFAGEDDYAFFSLIERGYRVVHVPGAAVRHGGCDHHDDRERRLTMLAGLAGYAFFLLREEPAHRVEVVKFLLGGMVGAGRAWRLGRTSEANGLRRHTLKLAAALRGLGLYTRSCCSHGLPRRV
jgi:glycosyltransferase involved in cell wall biosynthesis